MTTDFIRPRQRVLTALSPHNANANVIVPSRHRTGGTANLLRSRLLVGTDTVTFRGFLDTVYGDLNPRGFAGDEITRLSFDSAGELLGALNFAAAGQRPNVESIEVRFPAGFFNVPALWNETVGAFYFMGQPETIGVHAYLDGELGNEIPVEFRTLEMTSSLAGFDWAVLPDEGFFVDFNVAPVGQDLTDFLDDTNWAVLIPPFDGGPGINVSAVVANTPTQLFVDIPNGAASPGDIARVTFTPPGGSTAQRIDRITPTVSPS